MGRTRALMATILIFSLARWAPPPPRRDAAADLARAAGHRHGRRVGVGRRAGERDVAGGASRQGHQHHAVGLGDRLHPGRDARGAVPRRARAGRRSWRWLFAVGVLPALFALWVRRTFAEPDAGAATRSRRARRRTRSRCSSGRRSLGRTLLRIAADGCVQFAYWGLFFWLPGFLAPARRAGRRGHEPRPLDGWIIPMQIGAYLGYLSFGFIAEKFGRRQTFIAVHARARRSWCRSTARWPAAPWC